MSVQFTIEHTFFQVPGPSPTVSPGNSSTDYWTNNNANAVLPEDLVPTVSPTTSSPTVTQSPTNAPTGWRIPENGRCFAFDLDDGDRHQVLGREANPAESCQIAFFQNYPITEFPDWVYPYECLGSDEVVSHVCCDFGRDIPFAPLPDTQPDLLCEPLRPPPPTEVPTESPTEEPSAEPTTGEPTVFNSQFGEYDLDTCDDELAAADSCLGEERGTLLTELDIEGSFKLAFLAFLGKTDDLGFCSTANQQVCKTVWDFTQFEGCESQTKEYVRCVFDDVLMPKYQVEDMTCSFRGCACAQELENAEICVAIGGEGLDGSCDACFDPQRPFRDVYPHETELYFEEALSMTPSDDKNFCKVANMMVASQFDPETGESSCCCLPETEAYTKCMFENEWVSKYHVTDTACSYVGKPTSKILLAVAMALLAYFSILALYCYGRQAYNLLLRFCNKDTEDEEKPTTDSDTVENMSEKTPKEDDDENSQHLDGAIATPAEMESPLSSGVTMEEFALQKKAENPLDDTVANIESTGHEAEQNSFQFDQFSEKQQEKDDPLDDTITNITSTLLTAERNSFRFDKFNENIQEENGGNDDELKERTDLNNFV